MKFFLITETIFQIIKIFFIYILIKTYGFLYGISLTYFILSTYHLLMGYLFKLEYLSFDKSLLGFCNRDQYNINLILCFNGNFNQENIKNAIINRLIKKIQKMRCKVVYKFFNYYWQEFSLEECEKNILFSELKCKDDLNEYLSNEINKRIDTLNDFPYLINIIKFTENNLEDNCTGVIHFKFDHVLTDGLGVLTLLLFLSDDVKLEIFPRMLRTKFSYSFLMELKDTI